MIVQSLKVKTPDFDAIGLPPDRSPFIHLCWLLHNQCNHRCSYCAEINWGGSFKDLNLQHAKNFVEKAIGHFADRRLMVSFTGGEPTLWPDFGIFVKWLKSKKAVITMTTNGTRHSSFFQEHARHFSWISFSFHPEFTRPDRFLESLIEVSKHCPVSLRIMFPPSGAEFEKSRVFLNLVNKFNLEGKFPNFIRCEVVPVATGFGTEFTAPAEYSEAQEKIFNPPAFSINADRGKFADDIPINYLRAFRLEQPNLPIRFDAHELISADTANFEGWLCDIGLEQLFIDHRGQVIRAGCRVGGIVGWLKQGVFNFPTGPVLCPKSYCHCITDVLTSKRSPKWQKAHSKESISQPMWLRFQYTKLHFRFRNWLTQTEVKLNSKSAISNSSFSMPSSFEVAAFRTYQIVIKTVWILSMKALWWKPLRKPYYFLKFQFNKRVLGKKVV